MWVSSYKPSNSDWYIVKLNNKRTLLNWNKHNKFWCDFAGKTYSEDEVTQWLDDSKCENENVIKTNTSTPKIMSDRKRYINYNDLVIIEIDTTINPETYLGWYVDLSPDCDTLFKQCNDKDTLNNNCYPIVASEIHNGVMNFEAFELNIIPLFSLESYSNAGELLFYINNTYALWNKNL